MDQKINRRETLVNSHSLMAGHIEAMNNWKADEQELNEKRQSLSTRLEQIKQQAVEDTAKPGRPKRTLRPRMHRPSHGATPKVKRPPMPMHKKPQKTWQPPPSMIVGRA
ncbi:Uncharacterized protein AC518_0002 [Pseudomonas syringae pv. syringae]|nr:Uncharacterized protein AC518_0002 [Pseudomonas syringae pv. syringae]PHN18269.1 hypothetical protein AO256_11910 [Pseudomonas syringae]KWS16588.1 hypothetical protein AL063_05235 [Pseudomonas syringae pv. syringae]KWS26131.1 hypothetical protein AL062_10390 [Pseudomonas syringae pv. syringae]PHX26804.1 hypothetical protein AO278_13565 [Pseudomonas syringae pv. syringae]